MWRVQAGMGWGLVGEEGCQQTGSKGIPLGSGWGQTEAREERDFLPGRKMGSESRACLWISRHRKPARELRTNWVGQF